LPSRRTLFVLLGGAVLGGVALFFLFRANQPVSFAAEEALCRRFMELKNARDPRAADLLAPKPDIPNVVASDEEAERLDGALVLHRDLRIIDVWPEKPDPRHPAPRFVLVTQGSYDRHFQVATPEGVKSRSRSLYNPDVVVEVRDGKIIGLQARFHEEPAKPLTPRERERLRRLLTGQ
jgi:hypothetical protein